MLYSSSRPARTATAVLFVIVAAGLTRSLGWYTFHTRGSAHTDTVSCQSSHGLTAFYFILWLVCGSVSDQKSEFLAVSRMIFIHFELID